MIAVQVQRRLGGVAVTRVVDFPIPPMLGATVIYPDGSETTITRIWIRLRERALGTHPPSVLVEMLEEPIDGLASARVHGWREVAPTTT